MKRMIVSILAATAIMASGSMVPSAHGWGKDKAKTSDSGMYQSGASSGSSTDMNRDRAMDKGKTSDSGMVQGGAYSRSSTDMSQGSGSFEVSKMTGKEIMGMNGDKLGTIKDFVVDPNGHVFALISRDDMSGKTVAVPFEAFSFTGMTGMDKDHFSLNLSKDQLSNAPDFNQSALSDRTWSEGVYRHFGIQPRWSDQGMIGYGTQGGSSQGEMSTQPGASQDQGFQGSGQGSMGGQSSQPKTNY